jgi:DNA polymerase elongation subunit (family B)
MNIITYEIVDVLTNVNPWSNESLTKNPIQQINILEKNIIMDKVILVMHIIHTNNTSICMDIDHRCNYININKCVDEKELMQLFIQIMQKLKPELIVGFNLDYDNKYILKRIENNDIEDSINFNDFETFDIWNYCKKNYKLMSYSLEHIATHFSLEFNPKNKNNSCCLTCIDLLNKIKHS